MIGRLPLSSTLVVVSLVLASTAHAAGPDRKECLAATDDGQKLRDDGKLSAARDKFITCSAKACPAVVAKQCSQWLEEVERDVPTISFRVIDEQKKELLDVRVLVDGKKISDTVEAKARAMDPGDHTIRVERADGKSVEQKILLRAGEKNRIVELAFEAPSAPVVPAAAAPAPTPAGPVTVNGESFKVPMLGWIGLGVGVLGGIGTFAFASSAKSETDDLRSQCGPTCDPSKRDSIDSKLLLANVSLGVGIVGLGVGVVATILENTGKKKDTTAAAHASVSVDAGPGSLFVRGSF